jgi:hypothetical protein
MILEHGGSPMIRAALSLLILLGMVQLCEAKLEVKNLQLSFGPYGPERTSLEVLPQDELFFRFQLEGVQTNKDGKTEIEQTVLLKDSQGKTVFEKSGLISRQLGFSGGSLTTYATLNISPKAPTGDYTYVVNFKDRLSGETTSFEKKITCKGAQFALLSPRFFRDPDGKVPAPVGGMINETIYFKLFCIGFDRKDKQVKVTMTLQVLDEQGKDILLKPVEVKGFITKAEEVEKAARLDFNGSLPLTRTGNFTLRIVLEDLQGKQTAKFEAPLKVQGP